MTMFNTENTEQSRERFTALPAGFYRVSISEVEFKENRNGTGNYFNFTFVVSHPEDFTGALLWHRLTFNHTSKAAVEIGRAALADLLYTVQIKEISSVESLQAAIIGKELVVETELEIGNDDREYPRVIGTWSLGGKHRNEKRTFSKVVLGETKRPARKPKSAAVKQNNSDVPFHHEPRSMRLEDVANRLANQC